MDSTNYPHSFFFIPKRRYPALHAIEGISQLDSSGNPSFRARGGEPDRRWQSPSPDSHIATPFSAAFPFLNGSDMATPFPMRPLALQRQRVFFLICYATAGGYAGSRGVKQFPYPINRMTKTRQPMGRGSVCLSIGELSRTLPR